MQNALTKNRHYKLLIQEFTRPVTWTAEIAGYHKLLRIGRDIYELVKGVREYTTNKTVNTLTRQSVCSIKAKYDRFKMGCLALPSQ